MRTVFYNVGGLLLHSCITILLNDRFARTEENVVSIHTSLGEIVGRRDNSINSFLGVPFAEPPVGRYRFRPSRPRRPWYPSKLFAFNFSSECLQSSLYTTEDSLSNDEDCLYLNIWTPRNAQKMSSSRSKRERDGELLPVLFWIYGGAFLQGAASRPVYYGHKLAAKGMVIVSCNYRVGALGFLVSTSDGLFGNYGLHDQKVAMQWVADHISAFGGDPNKITLFGESAGAMSISLHMFDQQYRQNLRKHIGEGGGGERSGRGQRGQGERDRHRDIPHRLFQGVIMQSNPMGYKYRTVAVANFIGEGYKQLLDCEDLSCLQAEPVDELLHVQDTMMAVPRAIGDFFTWGPVITDASYDREVRIHFAGALETSFGAAVALGAVVNSGPAPRRARGRVVPLGVDGSGSGGWIANISVFQPIDALKAFERINMPLVMGANAHEGTMFVFTAFPQRMMKIVFQALVFSFFRASAPAIMELYAPLIRYISRSPYPDFRLALSTIIGDYLFRCPNQLFATLAAERNSNGYNSNNNVDNGRHRTGGGGSRVGGEDEETESDEGEDEETERRSDPGRWRSSSAAEELEGSADSAGVFLYEFAHATRTPGYSFCDGLACHTAELPYAFNHLDIIAADYSWVEQPSPHVITDLDLEISPDESAKTQSSSPPDNGIGNGNADVGDGSSPAFVFPDIFGAASSLMDRLGASLGPGPRAQSLQQRLRLDASVSHAMSRYWTSFARWGDPNGRVAVNGYLSRPTAIDGSPLAVWPRLFGDLPPLDSMDTPDNGGDVGARGGDARGSSKSQKASNKRGGADSGEQAGKEQRRRRMQEEQEQGWRNRGGRKEEARSSYQLFTSGGSQRSTRLRRAIETAYHHLSRGSPVSVPFPVNEQGQGQHTQEGQRDDVLLMRGGGIVNVHGHDGEDDFDWSDDGGMGAGVNADHSYGRTPNLGNSLTGDDSVDESVILHVMRFEDDAKVVVFSPECVCRFWNNLEYRF